VNRVEMTLRDAYARVIAVNEELAVGAINEAQAIGHDLEHDLARDLGADLHPYRCACGEGFPWPGLLDAHQRRSGHALREAA
jgi:hypothetical protein